MIIPDHLKRYGVALLAPRGSVLGHDPCGGSEVVLWEDFHTLESVGIPVRVYAREAREGAPVLRISTHINAPLLTSLEYCGRFVFRERQAAVLVAYNEPTVAGLVPCRTIVRFDWSTPLPRYWKLPGWLSRFREAIYLFPSESERRLFLKHHPLIPETSTVVIPNAVDIGLFRPMSKKGGNSLRVGFAGQWVPGKGITVLLKAWRIVKSRLPSAELWLAGSSRLWKAINMPPGAKEVTVQVEAMAREGLLQIAGEYSRSQMPVFWNSVDVAVVPSIYEPFGLVALEAMACGVPVVASSVGGLREIVIHGESGLLVPPNDPEQLAEALITLLLDTPLRCQMAQKARRRAEMFSLERRAKEVLALVGSIALRKLTNSERKEGDD